MKISIMNKICVSVSARTAAEFARKFREATLAADFVEIRFDGFDKGEAEKVTGELGDRCFATFRPREQGGFREISLKERIEFWNAGKFKCGADLEEDVIDSPFRSKYHPVICSYHDFSGVPANLDKIYERLGSKQPEVIKIAAAAGDAADAIPLWQLLLRAVSEGKKLIPVAMGEAGKWTRILAPAYGAYLTFASLDDHDATAPGQISLREMKDLYRVNELDAGTDVYGIIAGNTSYSMSPAMQNAAFAEASLNSVFVPFQVLDLEAFMTRMVRPETREIDLNLKGFAVTNPHKTAIMKHLDEIDDAARGIGAVNTVKIENGKLRGTNTDADGFIDPLKTVYGDLAGVDVAVIGAGGASRACIYALQNEGATVTVFARDTKKAEPLNRDFGVLIEDFNDGASFNRFDILVNTTPLGTKGEFEIETPARAEQLENVKLVYDLVYNPIETLLMSEADKAGVPKIGGLAMLAAQGMAQFKLWTGLFAPREKMIEAVLRKLG